MRVPAQGQGLAAVQSPAGTVGGAHRLSDQLVRLWNTEARGE